MNENKTNPTKFLDTVKILFPDQTAKAKINLKNDKGEPITTDDLPNYINQFFSSIGTTLSAENPFDSATYIFNDVKYPEQFHLRMFNEDQVLVEIKILKISKARSFEKLELVLSPKFKN